MCAIRASEVLAYLNELGYTNITGPQLKEFIHDLKRLIKYEESLQDAEPDFINSDIFNILHKSSTVASRAKIKEKRENLITVEILRSKPVPDLQRSESFSRRSNYASVPSASCSSIQTRPEMDEKSHTSTAISTEKLTHPENPPAPKQRPPSRPKSALIKVRRVPLKPCKSDPVALYHYYQEQWNKRKIPGLESHSDIRWATRERLLGDSEACASSQARKKPNL